MAVTSVATKITEKENELLEKITKEYGYLSKSEVIRSALRLYLNLLSLEPKDRLIVLRLINEIVAPSRKGAMELLEEVHKEEEP